MSARFERPEGGCTRDWTRMVKEPDWKDTAKLGLATLFYVGIVVLTLWRLWE